MSALPASGSDKKAGEKHAIRRAGGIESAWKIAAVLFVSSAFYCLSLWRVGIRFEQKRDKIAAMLS